MSLTVIYFKPLDSGRLVFIKSFNFNEDEDATKFAQRMKDSRYDVVIAESTGINVIGGGMAYRLKKFGFYKVYRMLNWSIIFGLIIAVIFSYLYFSVYKK